MLPKDGVPSPGRTRVRTCSIASGWLQRSFVNGSGCLAIDVSADGLSVTSEPFVIGGGPSLQPMKRIRASPPIRMVIGIAYAPFFWSHEAKCCRIPIQAGYECACVIRLALGRGVAAPARRQILWCQSVDAGARSNVTNGSRWCNFPP